MAQADTETETLREEIERLRLEVQQLRDDRAAAVAAGQAAYASLSVLLSRFQGSHE